MTNELDYIWFLSEQGIADILVRKHRNGPIGEVDLQFHDRYASFNNLDRTRSGII